MTDRKKPDLDEEYKTRAELFTAAGVDFIPFRGTRDKALAEIVAAARETARMVIEVHWVENPKDWDEHYGLGLMDGAIASYCTLRSFLETAEFTG